MSETDALTARLDQIGQIAGADVLGPDGFASVPDVYHYGYCHALALELAAQTGWPIVGLYTGKWGDMDHFLVRRPDGLLLDVHGAHTDEEVLQAWGDGTGYYEIRSTTPERIRAEVARGDAEDPADVAALSHAVAAVLLELPQGEACSPAPARSPAAALAAAAAPTAIETALSSAPTVVEEVGTSSRPRLLEHELTR